MARHLELIVEGPANHALGVYDVGHPGGAESEYALNIVQTTDIPGCVAPKFVRNSNRVSETLAPFHAFRAYSDDYRNKRLKFIMSFAETPDLDRSSEGESPNIEEQNDIPASILRKGEWFARTERDSEVRSLRAYL